MNRVNLLVRQNIAVVSCVTQIVELRECWAKPTILLATGPQDFMWSQTLQEHLYSCMRVCVWMYGCMYVTGR